MSTLIDLYIFNTFMCKNIFKMYNSYQNLSAKCKY